jgi:carboxypeptidase Q
MNRSLLLAFLLSAFVQLPLIAQSSDDDAFFIRSIYDEAMTNGDAYNWLDYLTNKIGPRLGGSPESAAAVEYVRQMLDTMGMDTVYLQPCMVPHWERGEPEVGRIVSSSRMGTVDLNVLALGNSVGTGPEGVTAEVVEVQSLEDLAELGRDRLEGKIVFFNRPMDPTQINTFNAYGGAVDQRVYGASRASEFGALAVLVRSVTTRLDDIPHTGVTVYQEGVNPIPALAVSTRDANLLSDLLVTENIRVYLRNTSRMLKPKLSYNVIGEIRGSENPDEIILVGGHLDSWDVGRGAHDDGAGCVHAMDVVNILNKVDYQPKRTLRCVLFINEENGQAGALAYRDASFANDEYHLAAIESDRGGFTPRGFTFDAHESVFNQKFRKVLEWLPLLEPYGLSLDKGGSGADISRLKPQMGLLVGFAPDTQRYFDFHHASTDTLEAVNPRELQLGAAAMASLVYLLDKYGN